jgi:8-oxo-dGTP pyrophosphatase MutT (NUDIX family)
LSELIFTVDANDNPVEPMQRDYVIKNKLWRRASSCAIFSKDKTKVLCQKRSQQKDERPGFWIMEFSGKAKPNETPERTILRELTEELGLTPENRQLHFWKKIKSENRLQYEYLYWLCWDGDVGTLKFRDREVAEVKWFHTTEAINNLENSPKWYQYGFETELIESVLSLG